MSNTVRFLVALALVVVASCKKEDKTETPEPDSAAIALDPEAMAKVARELFATKFGCSNDQVDAKRRADLEDAGAEHLRFEVSGCSRTQYLDCRAHVAHGSTQTHCVEIRQPATRRE